MNEKVNLEPGWLRDDVKRAEERLREWTSKNIYKESENGQHIETGKDCMPFENRKTA